MNSRIVIIAAAWAAVCPQAVSSDEHSKPSGDQKETELVTELVREPVEYRRYVKQAMQGHLTAFGLILTERAPHPEYLAPHAAALASLAKEQATAFPEGSVSPATTDRIWEESDAFGKAIKKTDDAASRLVSAVESGNRHVMLNALVRLGESCESCHDKFRQDVD